MTRINRMVMRGFKSFGEKTDLVFDPQFNCILGPNGSGKSNVGDALCFVLGKGSAKGLRAEKSANLIYNGGKSKKPAKEGEVSIYFDNASQVFPVQTPEVKITRIIRENGQSIYKINEERKTRQEMLELLGAGNIDPDGYNIVLQGDIIRLVEMSSIERRQIIEDIAGIGVYEEKKQKTLNELEKVDQKLNEAEIILTERKTYLKELKQERDQAQKYKELADTITKNKATYLHMQMEKKSGQKDGLSKQINEHQEKISKKEQEITALKVTVADKKTQIQKINKEVEEKGEKEQVQVLHTVEKLKVDIQANKDRIVMCQNEITRLGTRKDQLSNSLSELDEKIAELQKQSESQEKEKTRITKEMNMIQEKIDSFRKKNNIAGAENIDKEIEELDKFIDEKQKEVQGLREQQQNLLREKDKIEYQVHTLDEKVAKVLELEKQNKGEIEKLKQMKQEFKKATLELNQALQEDASIGAQFANAREKMQRAQDELAKLEARQTRVRESTSGNIAIQSVLEQGSKLGAVYGLLSELGNVNSKYALALEIAAGPKLRSIVVGDDKTAENCITFLKSKKLGIATFLPLNKIKGSSADANAKALASAQGVHGFAADLVTYDAKFKNVFSYVFGNTLVVDNITVARRIGVGTVRMTTLEGDLVELSGAMQGGYRERQKGSMGFQEKEVVENLKDVEAAFADSQRVLTMLQEKRNELEKNITRLREFKANLEGDIIAKEKSLHLESDDLDADKKMRKDLDNQTKAVEKQLDEIQQQISTYNKSFAEAKIKKQQLRDRISQLRNPLLIAELNTFEQKKTEFKQKIMELEGNIRNTALQITNILAPEKENISKILKQHEKEQQDFNGEITQLQQLIKTQGSDLTEKERVQREFYGAFKDLFKHRDALSEQLQKVENQIIIAEEQIRSVEQKKNAISIEHARFSAEFAGMEEEWKQYTGVELYTDKNEEDLKKEIWEFERMVQRLGNVNLKALEIYAKVEEEYNSLIEKKNSLGKEKDEIFVMMNEIDTKKKELFMNTFTMVNQHFQNMFLAISTKGQAYLEVEDENNLFENGVAIKVRITGKKFMDIRSLSGGEKTMTALAFIFAIQEFEPASFYVFDEVDAALDKMNSDKLAKLIRKYCDKAQYIIISHNDGLIAEADTLYGVSMTADNMSKVVSLKV
ncbi:chromosome segregation protein SMC [Candidatus Woesearchaeota archaeon]|nr:chromosome segregation protein SMC [Candidatus Woesearchaeota archaeon]